MRPPTGRRIRFQDREWLMVGGAITLPEDYQRGTASYAHLRPDGFIYRYGVIIGTKDGIEDLGEVELPRPTGEAFARALGNFFGDSDEGWSDDDDDEGWSDDE